MRLSVKHTLKCCLFVDTFGADDLRCEERERAQLPASQALVTRPVVCIYYILSSHSSASENLAGIWKKNFSVLETAALTAPPTHPTSPARAPQHPDNPRSLANTPKGPTNLQHRLPTRALPSHPTL